MTMTRGRLEMAFLPQLNKRELIFMIDPALNLFKMKLFKKKSLLIFLVKVTKHLGKLNFQD